MLQVIQFPVLQDNYTFLIHNKESGQTAVVDPAVASEVLEKLSKLGLKLDYIINTHHHNDHIGGNAELKQKTGAKIIAYQGDTHRIPDIDIKVEDGDRINICDEAAEIMLLRGHTLGHIAYYFSKSGVLFCGDTLFSLGCGRLFEGSYEQMFGSLQKLAALPPQTLVYCAHEYTLANAKFAITIEPDNKNLQDRIKEVENLRKENKPTVPTTIGLELATNPFLRAKTVEEFAKIRKAKDSF